MRDDASYRRGYADGARDVILAVRGKLAAGEHARLDAWLSHLDGEWPASAPGRPEAG